MFNQNFNHNQPIYYYFYSSHVMFLM